MEYIHILYHSVMMKDEIFMVCCNVDVIGEYHPRQNKLNENGQIWSSHFSVVDSETD